MVRRKLKPLVAGNWKMNGLTSSLREVRTLTRWLDRNRPACDIMICPPATLISPVKDIAKGSLLKTGAQSCHFGEAGAHTGDISAQMLKNAGASAIIVGHSERRADHGETSKDVRCQAEAAHRAAVTAIICLGETAAERKNGQALRVIGAQLKGSLPPGGNARNTVIAYEPVWAIGSGVTPSHEDVAKAHAHIRKRLIALAGREEGASVRILYGGSVNGANAAKLMAIGNVDGALVGGASLKAKDFQKIISAYM